MSPNWCLCSDVMHDDIPSNEYVTRLFSREDVIVLQDHLICVPHDHPQLKSVHHYNIITTTSQRRNAVLRSVNGLYFFGLRGEISRAGPGAGISFGNISTHISIRPCIMKLKINTSSSSLDGSSVC